MRHFEPVAQFARDAVPGQLAIENSQGMICKKKKLNASLMNNSPPLELV
jgi:hypothetical protein